MKNLLGDAKQYAYVAVTTLFIALIPSAFLRLIFADAVPVGVIAALLVVLRPKWFQWDPLWNKDNKDLSASTTMFMALSGQGLTMALGAYSALSSPIYNFFDSEAIEMVRFGYKTVFPALAMIPATLLSFLLVAFWLWLAPGRRVPVLRAMVIGGLLVSFAAVGYGTIRAALYPRVDDYMEHLTHHAPSFSLPSLAKQDPYGTTKNGELEYRSVYKNLLIQRFVISEHCLVMVTRVTDVPPEKPRRSSSLWSKCDHVRIYSDPETGLYLLQADVDQVQRTFPYDVDSPDWRLISAKHLRKRICPPYLWIVGAALGFCIALGSLYRNRSLLALRRAERFFRQGMFGKNGLVSFADGFPPIRVAQELPFGPVVAIPFREGKVGSYREVDEPGEGVAHQGTIPELHERIDAAVANVYAYAFCAVLLPSSPLLVGLCLEIF